MPRISVRLGASAALIAVAIAATASTALADPAPYGRTAEVADAKLTPALRSAQTARVASSATVAENFEVLGHNDLGSLDTNADVWVHGNFAYVGTAGGPCTGRGVKIVDVTDLTAPKLIGTVAAREGTSAEDVVVRQVSTPFFTGDLLVAGIQRCSDDPALDEQQFGAEFWDVTNPYDPVKLGEIGVANGGGGVHELDLFQRGGNVYALLATPFSEWFDPVPGGDFRIVEATDPRHPLQVGEWGAGAHHLAPGPFWGLGSFGASFAHSARASADGRFAYVSYWDLGVLVLDISDVTQPRLVERTRFRKNVDGDAHSVSEYRTPKRLLLLQNDEDFDPRSPAEVFVAPPRFPSFIPGLQAGMANESPSGPPLWLEPGHRVSGDVVLADGHGCSAGDYPPGTAGKIAIVRTPFPFFDPEGGEEPSCSQAQQEEAAEAAGAIAVVHDFIATSTSPQWFDIGEVAIPVLFTDHETAQLMIRFGHATLVAQPPSWGFLRVFDARSGRQVAKFDDAPNVHALPAPEGVWSIHNNEVLGNRAYVSWYSNGILALDLTPLAQPDDIDDPVLVGRFVPPAAEQAVPLVWGVAVRQSDKVVFASDMNSGLWIVRPTGAAAP